MMIIQSLYDLLRQGTALDAAHVHEIKKCHLNFSKAQLAALSAQLLLKPCCTQVETDLIEFISIQYPDLRPCLKTIASPDPETSLNDHSPPKLLNILTKTAQQKQLSFTEMQWLLQGFLNATVKDSEMAIWLMTVSIKSLSQQNINDMTEIMRDSGEVYDYRNLALLNHRKLITRYPTGALSEKIALILPNIIAAFSQKYPIASNFLVAKSLGHTGGTWDKLSTIPGFTFPSEGIETLNILQKNIVAISVTHGAFNPLDEKVYQLRSATGTVQSIALAATSIASKILAIPADFLLMDVRFGKGAFFEEKETAQLLADQLMRLLRPSMKADYLLTDTPQPSGAAIGNRLEVLETISILKNDLHNPLWDNRSLKEQKALAVHMFIRLMKEIFPKLSAKKLEDEVEASFCNGEILIAFKNLLAAHKVSAENINALLNDPSFLLKGQSTFTYRATHSGKLKNIDQKTLGSFVNFELSTGLNQKAKKKENGAGVILQARLSDAIHAGDPLCQVFCKKSYLDDHQQEMTELLDTIFVVE